MLFSSISHVTHRQTGHNQLRFQVTNKNWCTTEKTVYITFSQKSNDSANEKSDIFRSYNKIFYHNIT